MIDINKSIERVANDVGYGVKWGIPFSAGVYLLSIVHQKAGSPRLVGHVGQIMATLFQKYQSHLPVNHSQAARNALYACLIPITGCFTSSIVNEIWMSKGGKTTEWFATKPNSRQKLRQVTYLLGNCLLGVITAMAIAKMFIPTRYMLPEFNQTVFVLSLWNWKLLAFGIAGFVIKGR